MATPLVYTSDTCTSGGMWVSRFWLVSGIMWLDWGILIGQWWSNLIATHFASIWRTFCKLKYCSVWPAFFSLLHAHTHTCTHTRAHTHTHIPARNSDESKRIANVFEEKVQHYSHPKPTGEHTIALLPVYYRSFWTSTALCFEPCVLQWQPMVPSQVGSKHCKITVIFSFTAFPLFLLLLLLLYSPSPFPSLLHHPLSSLLLLSSFLLPSPSFFLLSRWSPPSQWHSLASSSIPLSTPPLPSRRQMRGRWCGASWRNATRTIEDPSLVCYHQNSASSLHWQAVRWLIEGGIPWVVSFPDLKSVSRFGNETKLGSLIPRPEECLKVWEWNQVRQSHSQTWSCTKVWEWNQILVASDDLCPSHLPSYVPLLPTHTHTHTHTHTVVECFSYIRLKSMVSRFPHLLNIATQHVLSSLKNEVSHTHDYGDREVLLPLLHLFQELLTMVRTYVSGR